MNLSSLLGNLNYGTILLLMLIESTVIPFPSEVVVAPAAYHAAAGYQNVFLGAAINYAAAYYLGRPIIYSFVRSKWGKLCLINEEKVQKSEKYFDDHGVVATLTGRLLPVIRQLISVPAGLAKMNFWKFLLYTTIGAGIWNAVLAALGWYLHSIVPESQLEDKINEYSEYIKIVILVVFVIIVGYFAIRAVLKKERKQTS